MAVTRAREGAALVDLFVAAAGLFFRMRAAGKAIGAVSSWGGGTWGVLRSLARNGPQTVPALARARPVARQRIQRIADELANLGLAAFVANPRHKRSRLVRLTAAGERAFAVMDRRVGALAETLAAGLDQAELERATAVLGRVADRLDAMLVPGAPRRRHARRHDRATTPPPSS
ncbi:MAG: MarR family winged helix-turn-helix transcriptional regulator, partial [Alphaproteobacteria bacterium]